MDASLLAQAVGIPVARAALWAAPLASAFLHGEISTNARKAAFLAQVGHESGGFHWTREIWGPTPAQSRYEGRADLGNTHPGDGSRYRGRGLIQITGRANYARLCGRLAGMGCPDFVLHPEALETPQWAAVSAADYWLDRNLNGLADAGAFRTLTKRINGGYNGLDDRLARWDRAKRALRGT